MKKGGLVLISHFVILLTVYYAVLGQECQIGYYGTNCTERCPGNCTDQPCDRTTGRCLRCLPGQDGDYCGRECPTGYYGPNCTDRCKVNCTNKWCDRTTGWCVVCPDPLQRCAEECLVGYNYSSCQMPTCYNTTGWCLRCPFENNLACPIGCQEGYYGPDCTLACSNNCVNQLCDKSNGRCLRCPPGKSGDRCQQDWCPGDFCRNNGTCVGLYLCNCSMTDFFGDRCQYTSEDIPITDYEFRDIDVDNGVIHTSAGDITFQGDVTLNRVGPNVSLAVPSGSYLTLDDTMTRTCLKDINSCTSGFSLTCSYRFSDLDSSARQVLATTGAGLEEGVRGVSLYFQSGQVYSHVVTSTQQWTIQQPFNMVNNEWFNMTVSWHPTEGLWLLRDDKTIGSRRSPSTLPDRAEISRPLLIGSSNIMDSPDTVLHVRKLVTSPLFYVEIERINDVIVIKVDTSSDDSDLEIGEIIGIVVGVCDFFGIVCGVLVYLWRRAKRGKKKDEEDGSPSTSPSNEDSTDGGAKSNGKQEQKFSSLKMKERKEQNDNEDEEEEKRETSRRKRGMDNCGSKNDTIDEIKEKVEAAVKTVDQCKVVHSEDATNSLRFIQRTHSDYPLYRREIGEFMCDLSFPETCVRILKNEVTVPNIHNDKIWPVIHYTFCICWDFGAHCQKFAWRLAESGAVPFLTELLSQQHYFDNSHKEREAEVLTASMAVLRHIAIHVGKIIAFKDSNTIEVLRRFTTSRNERIKVSAIMALVKIVEEKDKDKLSDNSDVIETLVQWLTKAVDNKEDRRYAGFTAWALVACLAKMASNNDNKSKIVQAGTLNVFLEILKHSDSRPREQGFTAECLAVMANAEDVRGKIREFLGLVGALQDLQKSQDADVRRNVGKALNAIN